ncbi:hypothetical protein RV14_GL001930 [Enterococcus ratti]|uniref:Uncharacterized protein n=1 Tax=Enterococcus ratti TaxID=150033 RepID=A0A1L8W6U3_9ENTE|nr:hypothetical protein RV14_GL001930 [Enterococcus ratti]
MEGSISPSFQFINDGFTGLFDAACGNEAVVLEVISKFFVFFSDFSIVAG